MFWRALIIVCAIGSAACFTGGSGAQVGVRAGGGGGSDQRAPAQRGGWAQHQAYTCSNFHAAAGSCFTRYDGAEREACEVCREGKSCFMAVSDRRAQSLCQAYRENKSCFMAINDKVDRGWCEYLKEGKSCFLALDGQDRRACERGAVPAEHAFWAY